MLRTDPFTTVGGVETARFARTGVNLASLTRNGSIVTAISQSAHGLKAAGETVAISGVTVNNGDSVGAAPYNEDHFATPDSTDPKKFTYTIVGTPSDPDAPAPGAPILVGIYCLTRDANNHKIAILETAQPHQFKVGDALDVFNVFRGGMQVPPGQSYTDTVSVLAVISDTVFSYAMKNDPGGNADGSTGQEPIQFRSRWQIRRWAYESNICDLYAFDSNSALVPRAMSTYGYEQGPPFMFPQLIVRDNIFGLIGNSVPSGIVYDGFRLDSCQNVLAEGNILNLPGDNLIHYLFSQNVNAFNNRTPSGSALPLSEDVNGINFERRDTLEDRLADALTLSLL